jgi:Chitobiase/beta-hexosaminidase C-terminal domain
LFRRLTLITFLCISPFLHAQFGPPEPQGSGPKLEPPTVFPDPGTYPTTEYVTLMDADPQATIHYTWDGSNPTSKSPVYDPYTIRAVAMHEGHTNSAIANFQFVVDRRDYTAYVSEEVLPGVRMIRDSDNDKMFLVKGEKAFALIDSGQGRGPLRQYLSQYTGGLPIEPIFTHSHGDHIGGNSTPVTVHVASPDGSQTADYVVTVLKP